MSGSNNIYIYMGGSCTFGWTFGMIPMIIGGIGQHQQMVVGLMSKAMGQINCQVKRSRTSSNCSTSDRCRHLAVYGLSLSSAAVAQVTHLWLEFASGI